MDNQKLIYLTILHGWQCQWAIWSKSCAVIDDSAGKLNSRFLTFFDPVQEIVRSRVKKFVTVENVTDWEALIERQRSAKDSQTWEFIYNFLDQWCIFTEKWSSKLGAWPNWTPTNVSCILSVMLKNTTHCLDQGLTQAIPFNLHATD